MNASELGRKSVGARILIWAVSVFTGAGCFVAAQSPTKLEFRHHFVDRDLPGSSYGQSTLVDVDRDGDLDFITGGKDKQKSVYWFEFQAADKWVRHVLGIEHPSDVGGTAFDVDGDGWVDHVTGGVWYRNTGKPRQEQFERIVFDPALNGVHDIVAADLDLDARLDVITMSDKNNLRWYRIPGTQNSLGNGTTSVLRCTQVWRSATLMEMVILTSRVRTCGSRIRGAAASIGSSIRFRSEIQISPIRCRRAV